MNKYWFDIQYYVSVYAEDEETAVELARDAVLNGEVDSEEIILWDVYEEIERDS